jgi:hypothetical protein
MFKPITISCQEMLQIPNINHGICLKKNNSFSSSVLPCIYPKWKQRYLVLAGNYLYRFENEHGTEIKGIPIPIDTAMFTIDESRCLIELKTIRKNYIFYFNSPKGTKVWYDALQKRKHLSIKENLGHAPLLPIIKKYNELSDSLFNQKVENERKFAALESTANPLIFDGV